MTPFEQLLKRLGACSTARDYVRRRGGSFARSWRDAGRGVVRGHEVRPFLCRPRCRHCAADFRKLVRGWRRWLANRVTDGNLRRVPGALREKGIIR